jgi:serine/threonine-protein kinase
MPAAIDLNWLQQQFPDLSQISTLQAGGQKQVFAAEHASDGPVVLKIIHPHQDAEMTRREIVAASQLSAHRVPQVLQDGLLTTSLGQCVWLRERRISGHTVRALIQTGPLDKVRVLKLGLHVLEVLVAAEQRRIVHRDIKPDNLICDPHDDFWVIDFGVARHLDLVSLTATGGFGKYTPGYGPPEQFRNQKPDIDVRCDLFALGVTLYECVTGGNPHRQGARDAQEVNRRVESTQLPALNLTFPSARDFADLVAAMTQPRRDHRPASTREAYDWMMQICQAEKI